MRIIKVVETKIIYHVLEVNENWPSDIDPKVHLADAVSNVGADRIFTDGKLADHSFKFVDDGTELSEHES